MELVPNGDSRPGNLSWDEMHRSASFRLPRDSRPSNLLGDEVSRSVSFRLPRDSLTASRPPSTPRTMVQGRDEEAHAMRLVPNGDSRPGNISWAEMHRSASFRLPRDSLPASRPPSPPLALVEGGGTRRHAPVDLVPNDNSRPGNLSGHEMHRSASFRLPRDSRPSNFPEFEMSRSVSFRLPRDSLTTSRPLSTTRTMVEGRDEEAHAMRLVPHGDSRPGNLSWAEVHRSASFRIPRDSLPASRPPSPPLALVEGEGTRRHAQMEDVPNGDSSSSGLSWAEMFRSASIRLPRDSLTAASPPSPPLSPVEGGSEETRAMQVVPNGDSGAINLPWSEMFRSASFRLPRDSLPAARLPSPPRIPSSMPNQEQADDQPSRAAEGVAALGSDAEMDADPPSHLALNIAMAHAGLALGLLLLYGLYRLLQGFLRPLLWALLCSIPLREARLALVSFWIAPLRAGLAPTLLAPLAAVLRASADTLSDARSAFLCHEIPPTASSKVGFTRLVRWLVSFWAFVICYESLGPVATILLLGAGIFLAEPRATANRISSFVDGCTNPTLAGNFVTAFFLNHLKTIVTIGLMVGMILGFLAGAVFFSYKIGVESKDAVMALKSHVERSNYAEKIGFKRWMDDNDIPSLMERYSAALYDTVWQQIDSLAVQYNLTEIANGFRDFMIGLPVDPSSAPSKAFVDSSPHPYTINLQSLSTRMKSREWAEVYVELDLILRELLIAREDLVGRAKGLAFQTIEMSKQLLASGTTLLSGSASLMFSVGLAVISGAAELMNFISQVMVFLWVLSYLITSDSGGAVEQVVEMLPVSKPMRHRITEVINKAISSVLLATVKITIFQGCLTWLLFRLCSVHFLYMSTVLAFISSLVPILPPWLSSILAAAQFFVERRYVRAVAMPVLHLILMDYGTSVIQEDIPGHNAYLTGLSILGGVTLFPNALEGAIMGPLIMTVFIALKNFYAEFVLADSQETSY